MTPDLHGVTDAQVWAREFLKRFDVSADDPEDVMIVWFANAIASGEAAGWLRALREQGIRQTVFTPGERPSGGFPTNPPRDTGGQEQ